MVRPRLVRCIQVKPVCLVRLSICLSCLSGWLLLQVLLLLLVLSVSQSSVISQSISQSVSQSVCLSVCRSVCLSVGRSCHVCLYGRYGTVRSVGRSVGRYGKVFVLSVCPSVAFRPPGRLAARSLARSFVVWLLTTFVLSTTTFYTFVIEVGFYGSTIMWDCYDHSSM